MKNKEIENFRRIWAGAHLFFTFASLNWFLTVLSLSFDIATITKILLPYLALFSLINPQKRLSFILMIIFQIVEALYSLPDIPNHRQVATFLNLSILYAEIFITDPAKQIQVIRSIGTRLAIIVYFFATFTKLNIDFLSPETSCAATFYNHVQSNFKFLPDNAPFLSVVIYFTIITEALLFIGLLIPKLLGRVIITGAIFHIILALDFEKHFVDFSTVMISLLWLFQDINPIQKRESQIIALAFLVVVALGFVTITETSLYFLYAAFLYILFVMWANPFFSKIITLQSLPPLSKPGYVIILLCILSGLGPFLGYKTRTAFNMYSNLSITHDSSNHLIIPKSLDLFGFLKDSVELKAANIGALSGLPSQGVMIPRVELLRLAAKDKNFTARYSDINGEHSTTVNQIPFLIRKFSIFRPTGEAVKDQCIW